MSHLLCKSYLLLHLHVHSRWQEANPMHCRARLKRFQTETYASELPLRQAASIAVRHNSHLWLQHYQFEAQDLESDKLQA